MSIDLQKGGSTLGGALLISGTCIGAGMLALPVVMAPFGFYPGLFVSVLCWLFMMCTGLLFLEATLWLPDGANVISITNRFLGKGGKVLGGASFIFLYYCLMVAYVSGGTPLLASALGQGFGGLFQGPVSYFFFALIFGCVVFLGAWLVDKVNGILMFGLVFSYILLLGIGSSEVNPHYFQHGNWKWSLLVAPTLFGAYGYHNIIPTISSYLRRNARKLRLAVVIGSTIPFVIYTFWQWMILGSLSADQLQEAAAKGEPVTLTLQAMTGSRWVGILGMYFGLFALVTSVLGVSLSMVDFLADGLKIPRVGKHRLLLCCLVFLPPTFLASLYPSLFLEAIGLAGGIGEAILNGLLPIAMVWVGRHKLKLASEVSLPGGRLVLSILFLFTLLIMGLELHHILSS